MRNPQRPLLRLQHTLHRLTLLGSKLHQDHVEPGPGLPSQPVPGQPFPAGEYPQQSKENFFYQSNRKHQLSGMWAVPNSTVSIYNVNPSFQRRITQVGTVRKTEAVGC